ncbi:MAG: DoxX family membrane protein [Bacteroidetes bacterium]|nr:DoxX family membrane protein [Bacteroidota bacterium]
MPKILMKIIQWVVGLLFIFSGLVKANDPLGLSYKMQEFFSAWHIQSLNDYTLMLAYAMNIFEVLAGVAVILGWRMKLFSWLLLLLILFFSFLTGYAAYSGKIKTCGCFGDCLPLTPVASFLKDVALLLLIILLFKYRSKIKSSITRPAPWIILMLVVMGTSLLQSFVLKHLPIVDCLPYKKGNNLAEQMKPPPGSVPDSISITFQYKRNGQMIEFDADHFPADFDSTYEYVNRFDKVIRKGNAIPPIVDFSLHDTSGTDVTQQTISQNGYTMWLFAKDFSNRQILDDSDFITILNRLKEKHIPFYIITADMQTALKIFGHLPFATILQCDGTVIKTAARVNPTFFLMNDSIIKAKIGGHDLDKVLLKITTLPIQN